VYRLTNGSRRQPHRKDRSVVPLTVYVELQTRIEIARFLDQPLSANRSRSGMRLSSLLEVSPSPSVS
jgi:hypothetical protein